jgi:CheY-like chemotaxis protein
MKTLPALTGTLLGLSIGTVGLACGDKLAVIGGGVRFERLYLSHHPGRVVLYVPRDSRLRVANDELRLADSLRRAGHSVEVIDEQQGLQRALQMASADLILVDVADDLPARMDAGRAANVAVVPVAYGPAPELRRTASTVQACVTALGRRTAPVLLRAVDNALERRSRGLVSACDAMAVPRGT